MSTSVLPATGPGGIAQREFALAAADHRPAAGGTVAAAALDLRSGLQVAWAPHRTGFTASLVKLDVLLALLLQRQDEGRSPTPTEQRLAYRMITTSDNDATTALWHRIGAGPGLGAALARFGLTETDPGPGGEWGLTRTTPADRIRLLTALTGHDGPLADGHRFAALRLLHRVVPGQRWGVTAAATDRGLPVRNGWVKNGWLPLRADDHRWVVTSAGIVPVGGGPMLLAVLSSGWPSLAEGVRVVEGLSRLAAGALGRARAGDGRPPQG
ncbi:MAG TPA: serine hydrolase [Kineosporiaceae bacterium]|nr:serine hydrolase [Kineosporiaceae bacterium]